jgi:hypothetical protein
VRSWRHSLAGTSNASYAEARRIAMRKRYKKKRRSCGVCKPGKRGITKRWSPREEMLVKRYEKGLE